MAHNSEQNIGMAQGATGYEHQAGDTFDAIVAGIGSTGIERIIKQEQVGRELGVIVSMSSEMQDLLTEMQRLDDPGSGKEPRLFPDSPVPHLPSGNSRLGSAGELIAA